MAEKTQWQEEYCARLGTMSNGQLLVEAIDTAIGDDYDGCHTYRGGWRNSAARYALYSRLYTEKFITVEDVAEMKGLVVAP